MFQPAPRRHRRLPTGTMVSYAEVKSYLSKREIPQLFESLMAGLMYHRPENHIGYLQSCLDDVKSNNETKVHWSTFVNAKKRKSKEILPPLTPKKQDSYSSSWSDNSRQSTPLPPISARTRNRASLEQQDFRNTYILYHNPPPVLAKPKVPVISVLGGLGTKIDELCERVVSRLRGVVHISTCSMLKTRMTIEGFYRMTAIPACAVVDSVLQAMSMVQSASALLVAGFPRNRGDIEEYRSRRVRMDGVVLVDFEEEALRRFLESEVDSGCVRPSEIEAELERFKQDIISVAEYYDQKEILTVVMGDQDLEEIIDDLVLAVDKVIENRKNAEDEDTGDIKKDHECESPCKALIPTPERMERPSTVEIREATEEDIKAIEADVKQINEETLGIIDSDTREENVMDNNLILPKEDEIEKVNLELEPNSKTHDDELQTIDVDINPKDATENCESIKEKIKLSEDEMKQDSSKIESLFTYNQEEMHADGKTTEIKKNDANGTEKEEISTDIIQAGSLEIKSSDVGVDNSDGSNKIAENEKSDRESKKDDDLTANLEVIEQKMEEPLNVKMHSLPLIFSFENISVDYDELKNLIANELEMCFIDFQELMRNDGSNDDKFNNDEAVSLLKGILKQDAVSYSNGFFIFKYPFYLVCDEIISELLSLGDLSFVCKVRENKSDPDLQSEYPEEKLFQSTQSEKLNVIFVTEDDIIKELKQSLQKIIDNKNEAERVTSDAAILKENKNFSDTINEKSDESENDLLQNDKIFSTENKTQGDENVTKGTDTDTDQENVTNKENQDIDIPFENEGLLIEEKTNKDEYEDSTGRDIEDLVTDDTLNEQSKPPNSLKSEEDSDLMPEELEVKDADSHVSSLANMSTETQKERAVLERQFGTEIPADDLTDNLNVDDAKFKMIRQGTYCADEIKDGVEETVEMEDESTSNCDGLIDVDHPDEEVINEEDRNLRSENKEKLENVNTAEEMTADVLNESEDKKIDDQENNLGKNIDENKEYEFENEENECKAKQEDYCESEILNCEEDAGDNNLDNSIANSQVSLKNQSEDGDKASNINADNIQELNLNDNEIEENEPVLCISKEEEDAVSDVSVQVLENSNKLLESNNLNKTDAADKINDDEFEITNEDIHSNKQLEKMEENKFEQNENEDKKNELSDGENADYENQEKDTKNADQPEMNIETENIDSSEKEKNEQNVMEEESLKNNSKEKSVQLSEHDNDSMLKGEQKTDISEVQKSDKQKLLDDSDSNDENVTIETHAEVHATDCESPASEELQNINEEDVHDNEAEESKNKETIKNAEHIDDKVTVGITSEIITTEEIDSKEVHKVEKEDISSDDSIDKQNENMSKQTFLDKTEKSETFSIENMVNEKYSNKIQERNGSGILDESRESDQMELEEPQERSSSSSRGEL